MRPLLSLTIANIRSFTRDRAALFWTMAFPLIFIAILGSSLQAGFGQIEAQIMKVGMIAEVTCVSKPFTIIPMVVTDVQDYIAAGQFRGGEQLIDAQNVTRPGTLLAPLAVSRRSDPAAGENPGERQRDAW